MPNDSCRFTGRFEKVRQPTCRVADNSHFVRRWDTRAGKLGQSPINYPEPPPPIRRGSGRVGRGDCKGRVQQVANRPNAISEAQGDRTRGPQGFVDTAHVVVRDVQRHGRCVVL